MMCKYSPLEDHRKKIISQFPITDRDGKTYPTIENAVEDALDRAFKDINFRTLQKKSEAYPQDKNIFSITSFLISELRKNNFISYFVTYFDSEPLCESCFDEWHHHACEIFLTVLKKYYSDARYGKAQKIVNMMFKHLYCMKFKNESDCLVLDDAYFAHCHLTLDSFTLTWFHREVVDNWHDYLECRGKEITQGRTDSWSNLLFVCTGHSREIRIERYNQDQSARLVPSQMLQSNDEKYHYMFFVDTIRQFFPKTHKPAPLKEHLTPEQKAYKNLTPFQAEFYIWPEIQLHLTAESLFGQSIEFDKTVSELQTKLAEPKCAGEEESFLDSVLNHLIHEGNEKKHGDIKKKIEKFSQFTPEQSSSKEYEKYDVSSAAKDIYKQMPLDKKIELLDKKIELLKTYSKKTKE